MNTPVRYLPLMNGTAFMGMGPNTGLNKGKEYPYVLWEEYEALSVECARWRHDAQQLFLRDRDQTILENELSALKQQLATARQDVWEEAAKICDAKAKYYRAMRGQGDTSDLIAARCALAIREQAKEAKPCVSLDDGLYKGGY